MKRSPLLPIALIPIVLLATPLVAQEWSQFRGPGGQGIAKGAKVPVTFTKENEIWRVPVGGKGHSSPVVWEKKLFLTREGARESEREVVCFDVETGKELWAQGFALMPYRQHRFNSFASSTPAVDEVQRYMLHKLHRYYARNATDFTLEGRTEHLRQRTAAIENLLGIAVGGRPAASGRGVQMRRLVHPRRLS